MFPYCQKCNRKEERDEVFDYYEAKLCPECYKKVDDVK